MRWHHAAGDESRTGEWRYRATVQANFLSGLFIALEGVDGSGKSTIAKRLVQALQEAGRRAILTREPGGTTTGEQIRTVLLGQESSAILPTTEMLLFAAARAQLVGEVIEPALRDGLIVVADRFTDSSLAYQWGARGLEKEAVVQAQKLATGGLEPDLKILLDLPIEAAVQRRMSDTHEVNRLDREVVQFHSRVREAYHSLVEADPARWRVVDASCVESEVWREVWLAVAARVFPS
jgi:dTMP kinase